MSDKKKPVAADRRKRPARAEGAMMPSTERAEEFRPTAMTIARQLGVSKSTISRALKDDRSISESVRKKVVKLAREIGYRPNAIARSLITGQSGVIALIMGDSSNPFYPEQLDRLLGILLHRNMQLMLFQVPRGGDVADVVPTLLQYQLDACIITAVSVSSRADRILADHNLATVLINRVPRDNHGCAVLCNNVAGGKEVGDFLLDTGAERLAFIAGPDDASTSLDREAGFMSSLQLRGVKLHSRAQGAYTFEGGAQACLSLLDAKIRPDAIFAANDIMALGAIDAATRQRGIRIPDDLQIVGFDDIRAASWPAYNLTTVAQPMDLLLERAVDLILERIQGRRKSETIYVNGELRQRGSTKPRKLAPTSN